MTPEDKRSVAGRLGALADRMRALAALTEGKSRLSPAEKAEAQALMKALKADLGGERDRINTAAGRGSLTPAEDAFYRPAIEGAAWRSEGRLEPGPCGAGVVVAAL